MYITFFTVKKLQNLLKILGYKTEWFKSLTLN